MTPHRTRIKICGLTREADILDAVGAGADALGLVFYAASPRSVSPERAAQLLRLVPPFVTAVGLFVNASIAEVQTVIAQAPVALLQFHGDESPEACAAIAAAVNRPYVRALRIGSKTTSQDLLEYASTYRATGPHFAGLLLDAMVEGYGGGGKVFDWSIIPEELAPQVVLSGGLSAHNATDAVVRVRPFAVDVSSGVEAAKGIKDADAMRRFVAAIRHADALPA
jgi:phosphoribosylanthranilate isomerase